MSTTHTPSAGTYAIDSTHTDVGFVVKHMMFAKVRGSFTGVTGTVDVQEDPTRSRVDVTIDAATFDSGNADRDTHVRSADFLDVENHPTITFRSESITQAGDHWKVTGPLTIKGVAQPVTLGLSYLGSGKDPWGNTKAGFSASTKIDREDFGITWNQAIEAGGVLVSKKVDIELDVQIAPVA